MKDIMASVAEAYETLYNEIWEQIRQKHLYKKYVGYDKINNSEVKPLTGEERICLDFTMKFLRS